MDPVEAESEVIHEVRPEDVRFAERKDLPPRLARIPETGDIVPLQRRLVP